MFMHNVCKRYAVNFSHVGTNVGVHFNIIGAGHLEMAVQQRIPTLTQKVIHAVQTQGHLTFSLV
jgi:hypothetical protein